MAPCPVGTLRTNAVTCFGMAITIDVMFTLHDFLQLCEGCVDYIGTCSDADTQVTLLLHDVHDASYILHLAFCITHRASIDTSRHHQTSSELDANSK